MKKLLISTDFSDRATHAAEYGYNLGRQIKSDIILFNAFIVPAEMPQATRIAWPMEDYASLKLESSDHLQHLKVHLKSKNETGGFQPTISCISEAGTVVDLVNDIDLSENIDLVIIGTHGSTGLNTLLLGNNCRKMIDRISRPLIMVPPEAQIAPIKKIAFATDFKHPKEDIISFHKLVSIAMLLNAEILIVYIYNEKDFSSEFTGWVNNSLLELSHKSYYKNINYTSILNNQTENGLDWLCEHGQIDMLSMVHRPQNFIESLITGSDTQKMAHHISIPLLVFQAKMHY